MSRIFSRKPLDTRIESCDPRRTRLCGQMLFDIEDYMLKIELEDIQKAAKALGGYSQHVTANATAFLNLSTLSPET